MAEFLAPSEMIDCDHPKVREFAAEAVRGATSDTEKAVRIHDAVRDKVKFGFLGRFYEHKASETLVGGRGFCNTKSALFTAALRAEKIPARIVYVDINTQILKDCVAPGTPYVDHSYTEVYLNDRWIKTDSYILDKQLFDNAQSMLKRTGETVGYGVHKNGTCEWDGHKDAFSQFVDDNEFPNLTTKTYGQFKDVKDLYASESVTWNKLHAPVRVIFPLLAWVASTFSIDRIRSGKFPV
mmetsp:Transcript_505/g.1732  ORF Transcript_505/g.1732 Transcript_505/m.1732 type:complete len:239 (+) Transcript_505:255-971(+)